MTASAASPKRLGPRAPRVEAVVRAESTGLREAVDQRSEQIERRFEKPIVIAALLVIPIMVLERPPPASRGQRLPQSQTGSSGGSSPLRWS